MSYKVAIVGAAGAVGKEILQLLENRSFPVGELRCFGSERSKGSFLSFQGDNVKVESIQTDSFESADFVFFSAGSAPSKQYIPIARKKAIVIDNSSAFRQTIDVPLVIPEVNPHAVKNHKNLIANPNCATIILLMALNPLHQIAKLKRVVVSTYQAASGAGLLAMQDLEQETKAYLNGSSYERQVVPHPYAFNLFLHTSPLQGDYVEEELKLLHESQKILEDTTIQIAATCVRVPVLRSHSEAINAEFHNPISKAEAYTALSKAKGVQVFEDRSSHLFPMPIHASYKNDIFCGRIREDLSQKNTLDLWVVGDQLLKGAALNAIQIAEMLL
jgi:aspartate-semialdehyde dehydrogenase